MRWGTPNRPNHGLKMYVHCAQYAKKWSPTVMIAHTKPQQSSYTHQNWFKPSTKGPFHRLSLAYRKASAISAGVNAVSTSSPATVRVGGGMTGGAGCSFFRARDIIQDGQNRGRRQSPRILSTSKTNTTSQLACKWSMPSSAPLHPCAPLCLNVAPLLFQRPHPPLR